MRRPKPDPILDALLRRLLAKYGGRQLFLFGPEGEPFRAARVPIEPDDFELFKGALCVIEELEATRPRPFFSVDARNRFIVAALDERHDLYFVVLLGDGEPEPHAAVLRPPLPTRTVEERVALLREELIPHLAPLRARPRDSS